MSVKYQQLWCKKIEMHPAETECQKKRGKCFQKVHKNAEDCCSYRGAAVVQVCTCNIFRFLSRKLFLSSFLIVIFLLPRDFPAWATDPHQRPKTKHLLPRRLRSRKTWRPRCPTRCRTIPPERSASSHPSSFLLFRLPWKQHRQGHTLSQSSLRVCSITAWWADRISGFPQRFFTAGQRFIKKKKKRENKDAAGKKNVWKMSNKKLDVLADGGEWHGEACRMEAGGRKHQFGRPRFSCVGFKFWQLLHGSLTTH